MKKKILVIFRLILTYIIICLALSSEVFAISQSVSSDFNSINSGEYPQIKEMIQQLKQQHPSWNFKILYTDIEWSEAIANEFVGHGSSPRNLIPANNSNYTGDWICPVCGPNKVYDSGSWLCASESAIKYMMDPRNSLNGSDIFQFLELSYNGYNMDTVRSMVSKASFLNNDSCINTLISAGEKYNVNVYYLIARILQEQGSDGTVLSSGAGYNGQYVGYYNVFNIGASGSGKDAVILNGLKRAESEGWTSIESSIDGGVRIIANSYIAKGQNTLYLQKFDVENTDGLYWHQYMQNILAAQNEGSELRRTLEKFNLIESDYTFVIPVYKNMPSSASPRPSTTSTGGTENELVRINVTNSLYIRETPGKNAKKIGSVFKDEIVTRLEKATSKIDGTYWDYIMKSDGTKGYAARETYDYESSYKLYLVPLSEESNPEPTPDPEPEQPQEPDVPDEIIRNDKIEVNKTINSAVITPNTTVQQIIDFLGADTTVKNANGDVLNPGDVVSTNCKINDTYSISVLGDVNGDGLITPSDYMNTKNYILGQNQLDNTAIIASDINRDGPITPSDYMRIKNYILGNTDISLSG